MASIFRQVVVAILSFTLAVPACAESKTVPSDPNAINGAVTDTYDYDAFGNLIHSTGTTPNNYLFAGEQFDSDLNLYYNAASVFFSKDGDFAGETIGSVAAKIRNGTISPADVSVNYVVRNGTRLIANNRSALALLRANIPESEWTLVNQTGDIEWELRVTNHLNNSGLTNEGSDLRSNSNHRIRTDCK